MITITCARPGCGVPLTARAIRRGRRFCSALCGSQSRTLAVKQAAGRKGGLAGAKTKQIRAVVRALTACGGQSPAEAAAYRKGYTNGYSAGAKTGEARGYRKGWAEACGDNIRVEART